MAALEAPKTPPSNPKLEGEVMVDIFFLKPRCWRAAGTAALTHLHPSFLINISRTKQGALLDKIFDAVRTQRWDKNFCQGR